jgi:hypothetical protein
VEKVMIDLSLNEGGNSQIIEPLIRELGTFTDIDFFVAISRRTYSSGVFAALDLKRQLGAVLVGEPTGGSPNGYGESRSLILPSSGTRVNYCVKYYHLSETPDPCICPDIWFGYLSVDYFAGRDPVLEYILSQ